MTSSRARALGCALALVLLLPARPAPARLFGRIRDRIRERIDRRVDKLQKRIEGTLDRPCGPEFRAALRDAVEAQRQCLKDPPAGSPIDRFEKLSEKEADAFCGSRSEEACLDFILDEQERVCDVKIAPLVATATKRRIECTREDVNCLGLNERLAVNRTQILALEADVKTAELALRALQSRLAKQKEDDVKLRAQCK